MQSVAPDIFRDEKGGSQRGCYSTIGVKHSMDVVILKLEFIG